MNKLAYKVIRDSRPKSNYRGAVVGCGRMGSTIDDEHVDMPHYPWPWAHAPAMVEAAGVELVAGVDIDTAKLEDFGERWGTSGLYTDVREMVACEAPDIVSVTTRPDERLDVVLELVEAGVRAIFATKPLCRSLAQADEMIEACHRSSTILTVACHLNWYAPYRAALELIRRGDIGQIRSIICNTPLNLSNIGSHTLSLARMFAGSNAQWVFGQMDNNEAAVLDHDLSGSGYVSYENGVVAIINSRVPEGSWSIEILCEKGRIVSRHHHTEFELWVQDKSFGQIDMGYEARRMFPYPWRPRSSMVDAIEGVAHSIEAGVEEICPGEFGREALEIAIALRESHRQDGIRIGLPLENRSLSITGRPRAN